MPGLYLLTLLVSIAGIAVIDRRFALAAWRTPGRTAAAIAIGGTIGLEALFAGPISGASMNPARSLAPAIVSGTWQDQWLYVAGPAIGAVAGVFLYNWVRGGEKPDFPDRIAS